MGIIHQGNGIFQLAEEFVNQTQCNIFLTGKAGTGKTTFLRHIRDTTAKNNIVTAPTGVAAINAGGVTLHSFLQLPIGTFIPENNPGRFGDRSRAVYTRGDLLSRIRINTEKRKLLQQLELLIIDEISMVRADLLDAADSILKFFRRNPSQPFGGVQVLMIGDLYQLPPVVPEDEYELLSKYYESPYFFSSRVIRENPPLCIELDTIFRQQDERFIALLEKIRHNRIDREGLEWLNSYYRPGFTPPAHEKYITLCTHHYKANAINQQELNNLPDKLFRFDAIMEGEFNPNTAPADTILNLKKGAQVMFIRNDTGEEKRYYNGKIGIVSELSQKEIRVTFPGEENSFAVNREEWKNIRYSFSEESKSIVGKELGSFHQYPIRLAWAITIHKSQGLTFEKAIIDAGSSFANGQVYVAFSRLRNLDGLVLHTPIHPECIKTDISIQDRFRFPKVSELKEKLLNEQEKFIYDILKKKFSIDSLIALFVEFRQHHREKHTSHREASLKFAGISLDSLTGFDKTNRKFQELLSKLLNQKSGNFSILEERVNAASQYFIANLRTKIQKEIEGHFREMDKLKKMRKYLKTLKALQQAVEEKISELEQAKILVRWVREKKSIPDLMMELKTMKMEKKQDDRLILPPRTLKGDSRKTSFDMFRSGMSISRIAHERKLTKGTIESHLIYYISEGELEVSLLVPEKKYEKIVSAINTQSFDSVAELKSVLGDDISYGEIRAVMSHLKNRKSGGNENQKIGEFLY